MWRGDSTGAACSGLVAPRAEGMGGVHAQHVALARPPEGDLDLADAVDAVARHPAKGHVRGDRPLDHRSRQLRLRSEGCSSRNMGRSHAGPVIRPGLGKIQRPVDKGMAMAGDVGGKHADLADRMFVAEAEVARPALCGGRGLRRMGRHRASRTGNEPCSRIAESLSVSTRPR